MKDEPHPLVLLNNRLPAKVGKQLAITEKLLANRKCDIFHVPQDGTIEQAVAKIAPGGTIRIAAGEYWLDGSLLIAKPLRFEGAGMKETIIFGKTEGVLINIQTPGSVFVTGVGFRQTMDSLSILSIDADVAEVRFCELVGTGAYDQNGINLINQTRGTIVSCFVSNCSRGIVVDDCSVGVLTGNCCEKNDQGLVFCQSSSVTAMNNISRQNEADGIIVADKSTVNLTENSCEENGYSGIAFVDSASGTVKNNICRLNGVSGIEINDETEVDLSVNYCEKNEGDGILFKKSSTGNVSNNFCRLNQRDGISMDNKSAVVLTGNRCEENERCGISFFTESASGTSLNNICRSNKIGIWVHNEASPKLSGNLCEKNEGAGIVWHGEEIFLPGE